MSTQPEPGTLRPGGRTAHVREVVFDATLAVLAEVGYAGLSVEGIAERSRVNRTTIYRRWRTKEAVLAAAINERVDTQFPIIANGSIADDLHQFGRMVVDFLTDDALQIAGIRRALFSDAAYAPGIAEIKHKFLAHRHRVAAIMVSAAIERGELSEDTDSRELVGFVAASLYYRKLVTDEHLDYEVAERAVRTALLAAEAGAFRKDGRRSRPPRSSR